MRRRSPGWIAKTRARRTPYFPKSKKKQKRGRIHLGESRALQKLINKLGYIMTGASCGWRCYTLLRSASARYYVWFVSSAKRAVSDFVYSQPVCCMRHRKNDAKFPVNHNTVVYTHSPQSTLEKHIIFIPSYNCECRTRPIHSIFRVRRVYGVRRCVCFSKRIFTFAQTTRKS